MGRVLLGAVFGVGVMAGYGAVAVPDPPQNYTHDEWRAVSAEAHHQKTRADRFEREVTLLLLDRDARRRELFAAQPADVPEADRIPAPGVPER